MKKLQSKVAVVTGGNSGIGLATAKAFLAEGATVVITGRNEAANQAALAELGPNAYALVSDAGKLSDIRQLAEQIQTQVAPTIDVLFMNAGVCQFAPMEAIDEAFFDYTFDINVKGVFFTIQALLPLLNDNGSIIMNGSVAAHVGMANSNVYAASKAAIISFAKTLSAETIQRGIRINTLSPGPIDTPLYQPDKLKMDGEAIGQMAQGILAKTAMNRFGSPDEVAKLAVFLASDDSSFIIGEEIIIDGGMITL